MMFSYFVLPCLAKEFGAVFEMDVFGSFGNFIMWGAW